MRRDRLLTELVREAFVVTLLDGNTFRGLLEAYDEGHLIFVNAEALSPDGATKVDGRLYVPRANVAYMQRP